MKGRLCLLVGCIVAAGFANDGWIGYTGAPRIEGKHPSIRMVDEVIHIKVGRKTMTADCRFTFKNEGNACSARIGFPDVNGNAESVDKAETVYNSFVSYVDGARVRTRFMTGDNPENWQVKTVKFAKGQTRRIRNVYTVELGVITVGGGEKRIPMVWQATYVVETGRSWKGTIGSSKVIFDFAGTTNLKSPIKLTRFKEGQADSDSFWAKNRSTVMWGGFTAPRVSGRQVIFEKKNWEPKSDEDDPVVRFGYWFRKYE